MPSAARSGRGGAGGKKILRRADGWPLDRYSVVGRAWAGDTAVVLGGGPSLTVEQVARTQVAKDRDGRRVHVVAINNAYQRAPWAEVCYFADADWWEQHRGKDEFKAFAGLKVTIEPTGSRVGDPDVHILRNANEFSGSPPSLSEDPGVLVTGMHSGFQVVNLLALGGVGRIVLLGYDMKPGPKVNGRLKNNWHDEHARQTPAGHYEIYRMPFKKAAPVLARLGVEVLNATPGSALEVFPKVEIESVLPDPQPALV